MELRPYQIDIINQAINSNLSTLIQVPTGGGKTVIARAIIDHLIHEQHKQVLFVAPKIILMDQTAKVFRDLNAHVVHGTRNYNKKQKVLVSTIQTACKRNINPDVIIIDEVHFGFDGKMLETLLKDKPHTRIIGLSATPYDQNGRLLKGFDLILNHYDMKYMIENKYLVNLESKKLVKILHLDKVDVTGGDYNLKALSKIMCTNRTVLEIVDSTSEYICQYKKTIVFAVDINHAELLAKAYRDREFIAKAVHSNLPQETAQHYINEFKKGNIKVLVSVAMLTTGFDVPDTDVAVIARPTKSQNLYKQMVGRVLRTADDKTHALLLDCGNVIDELGHPLDPIREKQTKENSNSSKKCELCGSDQISLIHQDDKSFWKCKKCKHLQPIEQGVYECKLCKRTYSYNAKFSILNNKLYLDCEDCPYPTLISEYTGQEILIPVEQKQHKKIDQKKSLVQVLEEEKRKKQAEKDLELELKYKQKREEEERKLMQFYKREEKFKKTFALQKIEEREKQKRINEFQREDNKSFQTIKNIIKAILIYEKNALLYNSNARSARKKIKKLQESHRDSNSEIEEKIRLLEQVSEENNQKSLSYREKMNESNDQLKQLRKVLKQNYTHNFIDDVILYIKSSLE